MADALYLYTQQKPLVIIHQSLAGFAETGLTRPLVMKLHGDALLEPKNTDEETATFPSEIAEGLIEQLRKRGLIFIGYGGNDHSLASFLRDLPSDALSWSVYWISSQIPDNDFGEWFKSHPNAVWVDHSRFEELMLLVREEFDLSHPDGGRFDKLLQTYRDTFAKLDSEIKEKPEDETKSALETAASKATEQFGDWWAVELAARKLKKSDPEKADRVYREGIEKFPLSAPLLGSYALFLKNMRQDMDRAEELYRRAIEADPNHANNVGNYGGFLLAKGATENGLEYVQRALEMAHPVQDRPLIVESQYYRYANGPAEGRDQSLRALAQLLKDGARSPGWSFSANIDRAKEDGHPSIPFLEAMATVIADDGEIAVLQEFDEWNNL